MIILLKLILLTSIWCLGLKILTSKGMLLERLGDFAHDKAREGELIYDPLIACEWCMPSIHSLVGYFFAVVIGVITVFSWRLVAIYPLVAMGSSLCSGIIWNAYLTLMSYKERNEAQTDFYDGLADEHEIETEYINSN